MKNQAPRLAIFTRRFREDLKFWIETDRRAALRTMELIESIMADPFQGIGKPEPLKFTLAGCWSRRITQEHRLVYQVNSDNIAFLQATYHYK